MESQEFTEIIKRILQENRDLKDRLDIVESILHSHLPIVGNEPS